MSEVRQRLGLYFEIYPWDVTATQIVQYFTQLLRHLRRPVVVLWDLCQIHRGGKVAEFCRRHRRLHLEWFPAYAPELNPEEYVWTQTKRTVSNACAENLDQLLDLVVEALGEVKQSPSLLSAGLAQAVKRKLVWDGRPYIHDLCDSQ